MPLPIRLPGLERCTAGRPPVLLEPRPIGPLVCSLGIRVTLFGRKDSSMRVKGRIHFIPAAWSILVFSGAALAQPAPPTLTQAPSVKEEVVVSATRGNEVETEIPGQATVIRARTSAAKTSTRWPM